MGGTYWYYYQLDNEIDFHNPAEPSTTYCPMLPGQVVNVLNVPVYFSSGHPRQRNSSVSSTNSELWTMNPQEKYLNPRPVPKPSLPPLNTLAPQTSAADHESSSSFTSPEPISSSHRRNASLPSSTVSLRSFRLPRKAPRRARGRSASPTHRSTGFRAVFHQFSPLKAASRGVRIRGGCQRPQGPHEENWLVDEVPPPEKTGLGDLKQPTSCGCTKISSGIGCATPMLGQDRAQTQDQTMVAGQSIKPLDTVEAVLATSTSQKYTGQRARSIEHSLRNPFNSTDQLRGEHISQQARYQEFRPLDALEEVFSGQNMPMGSSVGTNMLKDECRGIDTLCEASNKRLSTFASSPSTACPASDQSENTQRDTVNGLSDVQGRLLEVTLSDEYSSLPEQSRFSRWTCTTASSSLSSRASSVLVNGVSPSFTQRDGPTTQAMSSNQTASFVQSPNAMDKSGNSKFLCANRIPSIVSFSTISSYENTSSSSSPASEASDSNRDCRDQPTSMQKRYGMMIGGFQGYKLPIDGQNSRSRSDFLKPHSTDDRPDNTYSHHGAGDPAPETIDLEYSNLTSMQELINELSYLGDMIQK